MINLRGNDKSETHMQAVEFQANVVDGTIEIPKTVRDKFKGEVNVILYSDDGDIGDDGWPQQNRRRWELVAKKIKLGLSEMESDELRRLQQMLDDQLAKIGKRPLEELERLYDELAQKE